MPTSTAAHLTQALAEHQLLETAQLETLTRSLAREAPDPRTLTAELIKRGWLTAFQANLLLQGRAAELVLGPYVLLERLGEGSLGQVFKARHLLLRRIMTLKVLRKELLSRPEAAQRFHREIQPAAHLDHPYLVRAHAAQVGSIDFLVMEHIEGIDLGRLVQKQGPLPVAQSCLHARQAAEALQYLAEHGLAHRDLKPSNLLVTDAGKTIKALDPGLAHALTPDSRATPDYLAPEQVEAPRRADLRADLYSLGCTLYFMLTGKAPFAAGRRAEPPPVEQVRPEVPAALGGIVRKLMARRPEDRYPTPAAVVDALSPFTRPSLPATPSAARAPAAPVSGVAKTVLGSAQEVAALGVEAFELKGVMLLGRDRGCVQIHLPHPQVSRCHARITLQGTTATLLDLGSANGTFVNGQRLGGPATLRPGDQVDVGPYALLFTGTALVPRPRTNNIELVARGLRRQVRDRQTGAPLLLLDDVSLVVRPRELVCLLGPSGSGKSTLLSVLSGRAGADGGVVLVNGKDLHASFEALKQDIAVVPQKDVLHESLAVGQALWYTARLRLPPDTSRAEVQGTLDEMLQTVGLTARCGTAIRHLSGGQLKRASLANEILCKPSLIFLDEVTSGLDEQTDREVMDLFRALADSGKTVVCVTHSLANVERTCHLVVLLTAGGKLAFVGRPAEAMTYFQVPRLGDVYERLAERPAEEWQKAFRASPFWRRYVADRLPPEAVAPVAVAVRPVHARQRWQSFLRQTRLLLARYAAVWRGDYPALLAMAGQALVVAVLLGLLFGDLGAVKGPEHARRSVNLLFLLAVSSFWFGCNSAAKEIVKERAIYRRERDFNLRADSYYASKLLLLTGLSWLQTVLLFATVCGWCGPPGPLLLELAVLMALALAGVTLGLAISAASATEEMALTLIPLAVIPQIILSGAISPLEGVSEKLALFGIATYWGKRGLDACLPAEVAQSLPGLEQHSAATALLVLLAHAAVGIVAALVLLHWQGKRRT